MFQARITTCFILILTTADAFTTQSNLPAFSAKNTGIGKLSLNNQPITTMNMIDPSSVSSFTDIFSSITLSDEVIPAPGEVSYSKVSYYSTLALYAMSFPGLWSTIKRSTTAKIKRKTYVR